MAAKSIGNPGLSAKIDVRPVASLADQIEARSGDYLHHCLKTIPSAERHSIWSRLYAASQSLGQAVRENTVAETVLEIGSNLLGCEEIAILELHADYRQISFLSSVGVTATHRHALLTHAERLSAEINRGQVRIVDKRVPGDEFLASLGITALVPLSQGHSAEGAIVFFNLLPQRQGFDSGDRELLGLLSVYVGPSLFGL